ncbi:hypothetical protein [Selenomonas sp. KH1T6]|uniref:hypothetical protein n=1 Tax=Selenomonas sp. KH1T6 TaxID=3158784 RepID=UPI0008A7436C|nr:hypothetical protein SAMN05216583_11650 [Selenomonas ruminantium]
MSRRNRKKNRQLSKKEVIKEEKNAEQEKNTFKEEQVTDKAEALVSQETSANQADSVVPNLKGGLIVYGTGDHLKDMLAWHSDLYERIVRVIDKNESKIGTRPEGLSCKVESPSVLKDLPAETWVAVSALRYYDEIVKELNELNPGLVCPDIDQAYAYLRQAESKGMLVYGVGAHLADMLSWHPDLKGRIGRVFDKDEKKKGQKAPGTDRKIESPEAMRALPAGTRIAISAIRYYEEIAGEIYALNPGLVCQDIDEAYSRLPELSSKKAVQPAKPTVKVRQGLSELQRQRLRGREAAERWRRRFLMECANVRKVFWGAKGIRANYLIQEFKPFMGRGDFFIDEDTALKGKIKNGLPVCVPEVLKDIRGKYKIIVLSHQYVEISERLRDYGYVENVDFVEGRQILGEDENGYIDVPCVDKKRVGMIVYGEGAHLAEIIKLHPELAWHIKRVIEKDKKKIGTLVKDIGVSVEPMEVLRDLPAGTEIVVSNIQYFQDIRKDIMVLNPGLICRTIDKVWQEYV